MPQSVLSGSTGASYLSLQIPELGSNINSINDSLSNAFAYLSPQNSFGTTHVSTKFYHKCKKIFYPDRSNFNKLSISFRKPNGDLFDFGADTTLPTAVNENVQTVLYFVIETKEPRLKAEINYTF